MNSPQYHVCKRLGGKRNAVWQVAPFAGQGLPALGVLKDFGGETRAFWQERQVHRRLEEAGLRVAPLLWAGNGQMLYGWVEGPLALDLVESLELCPQDRSAHEGLGWLCGWLLQFYRVSGGLILGDIHLRNFIVEPNQVCGLDFECCTPGMPERDLARLCMFTVTYRPAYTPAKEALALYFLDRCRELVSDWELLAREMQAQLAQISLRRGEAVDKGVIPRLLAGSGHAHQ